LVVTSPEFRKIGSDVILLSRDIFADAAVAVADNAKDAANKSRPSEKEKKQGVDFENLNKKGKETAKHLASGKLQGEARENIWDEVEQLREYVDDKLPAGEEAREKFIERLQQVSQFTSRARATLTSRSSRVPRRSQSTSDPSLRSSVSSRSTPTRPRMPSRRLPTSPRSPTRTKRSSRPAETSRRSSRRSPTNLSTTSSRPPRRYVVYCLLHVPC
jgi:hypothetical protein